MWGKRISTSRRMVNVLRFAAALIHFALCKNFEETKGGNMKRNTLIFFAEKSKRQFCHVNTSQMRSRPRCCSAIRIWWWWKWRQRYLAPKTFHHPSEPKTVFYRLAPSSHVFVLKIVDQLFLGSWELLVIACAKIRNMKNTKMRPTIMLMNRRWRDIFAKYHK